MLGPSPTPSNNFLLSFWEGIVIGMLALGKEKHHAKKTRYPCPLTSPWPCIDPMAMGKCSLAPIPLHQKENFLIATVQLSCDVLVSVKGQSPREW